MILRQKDCNRKQILNQEFITSESYNQQFLKTSVFEWIILQRVVFWFNNFTTHQVFKWNYFFLKKTNSVQKLAFKKFLLSIYTVKLSRLLFRCFTKLFGSRRKRILEKILIKNFDKMSDFESRNLFLVKVWIMFCK